MDDLIAKQTTQSKGDNTLAGGGEMGALMRAQNWQDSPFGIVEHWPQSLRTAVSICLASRFPIILLWGKDLRQFYNDAYRPILGQNKHPQALGQSAQECWPEIWDVIGPMLNGVIITSEATWSEKQLLLLDRNGYIEECYFTFSYSPIRDESGEVGGVFCAVTETTAEVLNERRLHMLRALAANTAQAKTIEETCQIALETLTNHSADLPFSLLYLLDADGSSAHLIGATGISIGTIASPHTIALTSPDAMWPFSQSIGSGKPEVLDNLTQHFGATWNTLFHQDSSIPHTALILPILHAGEALPYGFLVAGVNPRLLLDTEYHDFFILLAGQIASTAAAAQAYQEAQARAEALAELDRAKTTFFSNISHELRTPLTLLLGPLEAVLADTKHSLDDEYRAHLEMARRNALRQLKLVNALLDFSRIEAGRMQAVYAPTDLAELTLNLASVFRSAVENANLRFIVESPPLPEPIYVDCEMWEKIVLNLLSNAFKFTFEGQIHVTLKMVDDAIVLSVADTGIGVQEEDLPHLFERFYQAREQHSRIQEGSGIGLSLVQELVRLHGGTIEVTSTVGKGTVFTVRLPRGSAHLPHDQIRTTRPLLSNAIGVSASYIEEVQHLLPGEQSYLDMNQMQNQPQHLLTQPQATTLSEVGTARVLIVDDNTDMRDYLVHLLSPYYMLQVAADGQSALHIARTWHPDLILSDVMMPVMDGFALLGAVRADPLLYLTPILLLSARAGEEATIEGLKIGADDYLVKPFSARELLARIRARIEIARLRREITINGQQWEAAFETMVDAVVVYDSNGAVLSINAAMCTLLGIDPAADYTPLSLHDRVSHILMRDEYGTVLPEEAWPQWRILSGEVVTEERAIDITMQTPGGLERQVSMTGAPLYTERGDVSRAVCIVRDVTERRRIEEALRKSEERFRTAFALARVGMALTDPTGHFLQVNKAYATITGYSPEELSQMDFLTITHPDDREAKRILIAQMLTGAIPGFVMEKRYIRKDSSLIWVRNSISLVTDRAGRPQNIIALTEDITARKQAEEKMERAQTERLLLLERERAALIAAETARQRVDTFLGIASHELKTPMTSIKGNMQLAMRRIARVIKNANDPQDIRYSLNEVQGMLERGLRQIAFLNRLVGDLVDVARIQAEKLELRIAPTNLNTIVREAVDEQRLMTPNRTINLTLSADEAPALMIDAERINQVVMNYLSNALKYSEAEHAVSVTVSQTGPSMYVAISDHGPGLPAEKQKRIWERFYRVPEIAVQSGSGVGLGLGLYICRTIIEQHGGQVGVESIEGLGSTFWFTLPIAEQQIEQEL